MAVNPQDSSWIERPSVDGDIDKARLGLEREKWLAENDFRREEIELKRSELDRSRWVNPLVIAVLAAAAAALGNAGVTLVSSYQQAQLEREKASATQNLNAGQARDTLRLEQTKSEAARILEVVKTNDPDKAAANLKFLIETGLIADEETRKRIQAYLDQRQPGKGISLPSTERVQASSVPANSIFCFFATALSPVEISRGGDAIKRMLAGEPFGLDRSSAVSEPQSATQINLRLRNIGHRSTLFAGFYERADANVVLTSTELNLIFSLLLSKQEVGLVFYGEATDEQLKTYRSSLAGRLTAQFTTAVGTSPICSG